MVLDYSERKPVSKNRPRKQPIATYLFLIGGAIATSFALGVLTGWFLYRPGGRMTVPSQAVTSNGTATAGNSVTPAQAPISAAGKVNGPSFTFYETLSRGNKGVVIGSGLNQSKPEASASAKTAAPTPVTTASTVAKDSDNLQKPTKESATKIVKPVESEKQSEAKPVAEKMEKEKATNDKNGKFIVQVASHREKKDADAMKAKINALGMAAYIVETRIQDKGTWYRVRVGRHLDQRAAQEIASRLGSGALVIPE